MKWLENGTEFEGTVAEYRELHSAPPAQNIAPKVEEKPAEEPNKPLPRTHAGKGVSVLIGMMEPRGFRSIKAAAAFLTERGIAVRSQRISADILNLGKHEGDGYSVLPSSRPEHTRAPIPETGTSAATESNLGI